MVQKEAYRAAGFDVNSRTGGNASTLAKHPTIKARVAELIEDRTQFKAKFASEPLSDSISEIDRLRSTGIVSREWIVEKLMENAEAARNNSQFAAATAALKLIGEMMGYVGVGRTPIKKDEEEKKELVAITPDSINKMIDGINRQRDQKKGSGK